MFFVDEDAQVADAVVAARLPYDRVNINGTSPFTFSSNDVVWSVSHSPFTAEILFSRTGVAFREVQLHRQNACSQHIVAFDPTLLTAWHYRQWKHHSSLVVPSWDVCVKSRRLVYISSKFRHFDGKLTSLRSCLTTIDRFSVCRSTCPSAPAATRGLLSGPTPRSVECTCTYVCTTRKISTYILTAAK